MFILLYDEDRTPPVQFLCVGSRVFLCGCNPEPRWGLYHGSMGTAKDIVFPEGSSPNNGDQPAYVLVDFDQCNGPKIEAGLSCVPVPMHETRCKFDCCKRTYMPLSLAWGKTAHTCQGLTVGPSQKGKPENMIKRIVIHPGKRSFEGNNVGLFYTILGRGTTLGDPSDPLSSAMCFAGNDMSNHRITNLWSQSDGKPFIMATLRKKWVDYLSSNVLPPSSLSSSQKSQLHHWSNTARFTIDQLHSALAMSHSDP